MSEKTPAKVNNRLVQRSQEPNPFRGDSCGDDAPVPGAPRAGNQLPIFQPVQQAGDVGIVGHHALSRLAAGEPLAAGPAQDAQDVILGGGKAGSPEQLFDGLGDGIAGLQEVEIDFLLDAGERRLLLDLGLEFLGHAFNIVVITIIFNTRCDGEGVGGFTLN